jgi:formate dehydrogenase subunit delta
VLPDKLVMMANQIAANARGLPHDAAVARVEGHLKQFWTPQMRRELAALATEPVDATADPLQPLVREALGIPVSEPIR